MMTTAHRSRMTMTTNIWNHLEHLMCRRSMSSVFLSWRTC